MEKREYFCGVFLCIGIALLSFVVSKQIPIGSVAIAIVLGIIIGNSTKTNKKSISATTAKIKIPIFIIGFILFSLIPTVGLLSQENIKIISKIGHYSLMTAMAGIGLKISFGSIVKDGLSVVLIGGLIFLTQILFSSFLIILFLK